jgi:hypothetical protein
MIQPSQMFESSFIHEGSQALDLQEIKVVRCREVGVVQTIEQNFQVIVDSSFLRSSCPRVPISDMISQLTLNPPPRNLELHGSEARPKLWLWPSKNTALLRSAGIPEEIDSDLVVTRSKAHPCAIDTFHVMLMSGIRTEVICNGVMRLCS